MNALARSFLTFAAGAVMAIVVGWTTMPAAAQPGAPAPVHVCVAPDNVLHLVDAGAPCPAGQRDMFFPSGPAPAGPQQTPRSSPTPDANHPCADPARLANLESQVAGLEASAEHGVLTRRVVAPFEVVDSAGKQIFVVDEGYAALFNAAGVAVARMSATDNGGYFTGVSADRGLTAVIGSSGTASGVKILGRDSSPRVDLSRDDQHDTYRLKFLSESGVAVAAIGQGFENKGGVMNIYSANGELKASVDHDNELKGRIAVWHNNHSIATLTEGKAGGLLAIYGVSGQRMVEAGVVPQGFGVVRAGPDGFSPGVGLLGLPGSYIAGKK